jgi:hypothetical protein
MDRICSIEGCLSKAKCRGWCNRHYHRWSRYGNPIHPYKTFPEPSHGTYERYYRESHRCRCADCRIAKNAHIREVGAQKRKISLGNDEEIPGANWRYLPGFDMYRISDSGIVQSFRLGVWRTRNPRVTPTGYKVLSLNRRSFRVHRLVLLAWIGPPPSDKPNALHRNGDPSDNRVDNLYWGDQKQNQLDRRRHGRNGYKLNESDVEMIRSSNLTNRDLADKFAVTPAHVLLIRQNKKWKI